MIKRKNGFTLIATVFIILVVTLLAITTSTLISSDAVVAVKNYHSLDAFYIASSGSEYYLKQLEADMDWTTPPTKESKAFSGGFFSITTTDESKNRITYLSTGVITVGASTYRRGILSTIRRTGGTLSDIAEEYVLYMGGTGGGTDETNVGNNITIIGSILVDSDVNIGSNTVISGDAYSSGDIVGDTGGISGTSEGDYEMPTSPPSLESSYYDNQIAIAQTYAAGDKTYSGGKTLSGVTYVNGNVIFQLNSTISITGTATIVATGTVLVRNNTTIGDRLHVIADGLITIENNVIIGKYGIWYSTVGFEVANNAETGDVGVGEGTQFITPGDCIFGNNCEFDGFLYVGGTLSIGNNMDFSGLICAGSVDDIGENSTFSTNPDVIDWSSVIGFGDMEGGANIDRISWDEEY